MTTRFHAYYRDLYENPRERELYLAGREHVYGAVVRLLARLGVRQVIDIGCSVGGLVELLNASGVDALGVDFPFPAVQQHHQTLQQSRGKFLYGDATRMDLPIQGARSALVILDSLRHFDDPGLLPKQRAEFVVIKENGSRSTVARSRQAGDQVRFYSPRDLAQAFPEHTPWELHAPRYLFRIRRPGSFAMHLFDRLPTYTLVLRRADLASRP
jgi:hypothetical protein